MRLPTPLRSASHPLARQVRALTKGPRDRREHGLFLVEGPRGVHEALAADAAVVFVMVAAGRLHEAPYTDLIAECLRRRTPVQPIQDALLDRLAPAEHGPGLLGACRLPPLADDPRGLLEAPGSGLIVVAWQIQNPGSVGALVRSAVAFGARGVLAAGGADPWSPKAVRASAGAIHRLPVARDGQADELLEKAVRAGYRLLGAAPRGGRPPEKVDWSGRIALVLGAEVAGLPTDARTGAALVTIPTTGAVESLSVPVAGAILLERFHALVRGPKTRR